MLNGGYRVVGGPPATRKLARQWVRIKAAEQARENYKIHVSGPNPRANINATDQSINTVVSGGVFTEIHKALDDGVPDAEERAHLKKLLNEIDAARDQKSFITSYQALIASAALQVAPF